MVLDDNQWETQTNHGSKLISSWKQSRLFTHTTKKGAKTFRLQLHIMGLNNQRTSTPRQQLLEDLTKFLEYKKNKGDSLLVVCGDFNGVHQTKFQQPPTCNQPKSC